MQNFNINPKFKNIVSPQRLSALLENVKTIAYRNTIKFQEYFPNASADDGIYIYTPNFFDSWHGGWWTGIFYMLYTAFGDERFRHYADSYSSRFYNLIKNNRIVHRDMGFVYIPICVPDILINRSTEALEAVILAAEYMVESYGETAGVNFEKGITKQKTQSKIRFPVAAAVNSLILRLAGGISESSRFKEVECGLVENCFKYNVNSDGRCFMNIAFDPAAGQVIPNDDDSSEYGFAARGDYIRASAWIAFALSLYYNPAGGEKYEQKLYKVITHFLGISGGSLAMFTPGDERGRKIVDTTSAAIFVCSFAEILKKLDTAHEHYLFYFNLFQKWFDFLTDHAISPSSGKQGFLDKGILLGGFEIDGRRVKNSCNICGDYFYLEALMHMTNGFESCWNVDRLYKGGKN